MANLKLCKPPWIDSIPHCSMLTSREVAQLLGCKAGALPGLQEWCGMPGPRDTTDEWYNRANHTPYWRAGDIIAWATGTEQQIEAELKIDVGGKRRREWRANLRKLIEMRKRAEEHGTKV